MKLNKLACATSVALVVASSAARAEEGPHTDTLGDSPHSISANIGVVSNYIWRGVTQTGDDAAVQGGVDYGHASGLYAGAWASNIDWGGGDPSYELDLYGGYGGEFGDFSYDLNTIYYWYPDADSDANFWEIGGSGTWKWITAGLQYTVWGEVSDGPFDSGDFYYYGSLEFPLPQDFGLGATLGHYDFDDDKVAYLDSVGQTRTKSADYTHWGVYLSKDAGQWGTFSLNYDQNNGSKKIGYDDDAKVWVGWNKEF